MEGKTILIIDDDPFILDLLQGMFSQAGANTLVAGLGSEGLRLLYQHHPDLIILDIMMPEKSGWEICLQIRELTSTPIIMLTALNTEEAIVRALESGAVDFVTKPFSTRVLLARAKAAMRQSAELQPPPQQKSAVYQDNHLSIDLDSRQVMINGEREHLTKTEFEILSLLIRHPAQVLTFDQILLAVWGPGYSENVDYVHSYISRLRRKLELDAKEPQYLQTEHGVGYRFQPQ